MEARECFFLPVSEDWKKMVFQERLWWIYLHSFYVWLDGFYSWFTFISMNILAGVDWLICFTDSFHKAFLGNPKTVVSFEFWLIDFSISFFKHFFNFWLSFNKDLGVSCIDFLPLCEDFAWHLQDYLYRCSESLSKSFWLIDWVAYCSDFCRTCVV